MLGLRSPFCILLSVVLLPTVLVVGEGKPSKDEEEKLAYEYCGNTPADVVFLLDSSNSIWGPDFRRQIIFVMNVVNMFQIGQDDTRVGLATFNDDVQIRFNLNDYYDKQELLNAINQVQPSYGSNTNTDIAIRYMRRRMFSRSGGSRSYVPRIGIIVTDGRSRNLLSTLIESSRAKRKKIHLFSIGVGSAVNDLELARMSSFPSDDFSFLVDGYKYLDSLKNILAIKTCQVTNPPTTTTTTTTTTSTTTTTTTTTPKPTTTTTTTTTPSTTTTTTTTTPSTTTTTTTTTTLPTTTSWLDVVREICYQKPVDLVFALDSSSEVLPGDFWNQLRFVRDFSLGLDVGPNNTRIGVVIYSDQVQHGFDINDHDSLAGAISDLYKLERTAGGTRVDEVIRYVRTKSFRRTVSRRNSAQVMILITGSKSRSVQKVKKQARLARRTGLTMIVIGVGDRVSDEELSIIAGSKMNDRNDEIDNLIPSLERNGPLRRGLYKVDTFENLINIVEDTAIETCTSEISPVPVSDQACGTRQEADVMFVVDSESAGKKNTKKTMDFMKKVADSVDLSEESVQLGMLSPQCRKEMESFRLDAHHNKDELKHSLDDKKDSQFSRLVKRMRRDAFKHRKGGRKEAKKIAVLIVDGLLEEPLKALKEARHARIKGIEVYVIVVGREHPQQEVMDMCNYPPQNHFFQVPDYDRLREIEDSLIQLLCDEL